MTSLVILNFYLYQVHSPKLLNLARDMTFQDFNCGLNKLNYINSKDIISTLKKNKKI